MIIDLAVYSNGKRREVGLDLPEAIEMCRHDPHSFVWLGLFEPTEDELVAVREEYGLDPLAAQDAVNAHQRPKVEVYGETLFVVLKTARYDDETETVEFAEIQLFIGNGFVISVRHGRASALAQVRARLERDPDLLGLGPSAVLYAVADRVVDDYLPVIEGIDNDLREVEVEVFGDHTRNAAQRIFKLKREVLEFSRNAYPLLEALDQLELADLPYMQDELDNNFRDVQDHLLRYTARIDSFSALLSDALNANLAQVAVRQNDDMRTISAWVAIGAIPTMFGGIYGMNFENMPELRSRFGYPIVLALIVGLCFAAYRNFKRAGWL